MAETFTPPKVPVAKGIAPTQTVDKAPPAEVLKQDFSMSDDMLSSPTESKVEIVNDKAVIGSEKKTETAPVEDKKEEAIDDSKSVIEPVKKEPAQIIKPPKEEKEVKAADKKEAVKLIVPASKDKVTRDYSGYTADEVQHLKQMSDSAYAYTTNLIKQNKEASKSADGLFRQHPEAYKLSPDYKKLENEVYFAETEKQAWNNALMLCKTGKPFKCPTGIDTATGNVVLGEEYQPSDAFEELLRQNVISVGNAAQQKKGQLLSQATSFKTKVQEDYQAIENERKARFGWVADPKLMDHTLAMVMEDGSTQDMPIKQVRNIILNLVPPYMRNNPISETLADMFVALRVQGLQLSEALAGKEVAEVKQEESTRVEPTSVVKPGAQLEEIGGVKTFSAAGMPD